MCKGVPSRIEGDVEADLDPEFAEVAVENGGLVTRLYTAFEAIAVPCGHGVDLAVDPDGLTIPIDHCGGIAEFARRGVVDEEEGNHDIGSVLSGLGAHGLQDRSFEWNGPLGRRTLASAADGILGKNGEIESAAWAGVEGLLGHVVNDGAEIFEPFLQAGVLAPHGVDGRSDGDLAGRAVDGGHSGLL